MFGNKQSKEFKRYIKQYQEEECEGKSFQLTALTGFNIIGAVKSIELYFSQRIECVAYISHNQLVNKKVKLLYFLDDTSPLKLLNIENLTPCDFVVKKVKNKDLYCIIKFKGKSKTRLFNSIIKELSKPLVIKEGNDVFEFDRTFKEYQGNLTIYNKTIKVSLCPEENSTDASLELNTFIKIKNDFKSFYNMVLLQCSKNLTDLANEWRRDGDTHEITANEIAKRIDSDFFALEVRKKTYTLYFNDDDLFWGHTILYKGNIETSEFETALEG